MTPLALVVPRLPLNGIDTAPVAKALPALNCTRAPPDAILKGNDATDVIPVGSVIEVMAGVPPTFTWDDKKFTKKFVPG